MATNTYSQNKLFTIKSSQKTITEVFHEIEKNSEYIIFYMDQLIDTNRKVNINVRKQQVSAILDQLFAGTDNTYSINDRQITIYRKGEQPTPQQEKNKFVKTLEKGEKEFAKEIETVKEQGQNIVPGKMVFRLYDTYGFPPEVTEELATENGMKIDKEEFEKLFKEHQEKSRAGSEQKFKGGLASTGEMETKYHTATHLLNAALKQVLGAHVHQRGSNITAERMRFDFSHPAKMTDEEKQKTEDLVNEWISQAIPVEHLEMKKEDAIKMGAEAMFIEKYGDIVSVYKIGDVSLELCGGPHVSNTSELGHFKIKKEESSSSGVRRIKAILC